MYNLCFYLNNVLNVSLQTQSCFNYLQTVTFRSQIKEGYYIKLTALNKYSFRMVSHKQTQYILDKNNASHIL